ncbi:MAG TPA: hypothetical protein VGP95_22255 [Gemmatimonadaceae bacterium]|nr:hypothetical protein [Gemmatimonadaceae bacterium]
MPLERRKDVLRRPLPYRDGVRPIRVFIEPQAPPGWRKALKRVRFRDLSFADPPAVGDASGFMVSPAVAVEAGPPDAPGWDPMDGLPTWEREFKASDLEVEPVRAGVTAWGDGGIDGVGAPTGARTSARVPISAHRSRSTRGASRTGRWSR